MPCRLRQKASGAPADIFATCSPTASLHEASETNSARATRQARGRYQPMAFRGRLCSMGTPLRKIRDFSEQPTLNATASCRERSSDRIEPLTACCAVGAARPRKAAGSSMAGAEGNGDPPFSISRSISRVRVGLPQSSRMDAGCEGLRRSYRQAKERAVQSAARLHDLANSHDHIFVFGHGMMSLHIANVLLAKGWRGRVRPLRYWGSICLEREL